MKKENNTQEESTFMKLWHNKRTHAAMVLGLWMIFLLFVLLIAFVGGNNESDELLTQEQNNEVEEVVEFQDYETMQSSLLKNNYKYEYSITSGDYKVIYKGEKMNEKESGYRENSNETIKYYIDETGLYKVVMDELHALDKLYENVNESYIDVEYILNEINIQSYMQEDLEETRTYTYNYVIDAINYEVVVTTDLNNITNINIKFEDKVYDLKFSEINEVTKLNYEPIEVN